MLALIIAIIRNALSETTSASYLTKDELGTYTTDKDTTILIALN
jgi:hypothetical protein